MHTRRSWAPVKQQAPEPAPSAAPSGAARRSIAVVTEDPALGEALRLATPERSVMIIATPLALADLLLQEHTAVLVLDSEVLGQSAPLVVDRLSEQFPELSLIAVGSRADERALSTQLSSGRIYRFLHRPASIERARTFVEAALRRQACLDAPAPATPEFWPALLKWGAALAALAVVTRVLIHLLAASPPPAAPTTPAPLEPVRPPPIASATVTPQQTRPQHR